MSARDTRRSRVVVTLGLAAMWSALLGAAPDEASQSAEMRVATIGYRLATAGLARCARRMPHTGLLLHDLAAYDQAQRPAIAHHFGLTSGMGVLDVVPGSSADQAGLRAGDEIVSLDDVPVVRLPLPASRKVASYDRIEAFSGLLAEALAKGEAGVTVRRAGAVGDIVLPQRLGCAVRFAVLPGESPAAWSDSRYAVVNRALAQAARDDELAFALAHEMAHVVLGHAETKRPALASLGIAGAKTRERELAADRLGTLITIDAGFGVDGARALFERLARAHGSLSLTHPSISSRMAAIQQSAAKAVPQAPSP